MTSEHFKQLVMPHYRLMLSVATRILGNSQAAADAVQDVAEILWTKRSLLDDFRNAQALCVTAVRNRCISIMRHENLGPLNGEPVERAMLNTSDSVSSDNETHCRDVLRIVDNLDEPRRTILKLSMQGYNTDEIAARTELKAGNVRQILSRTRMKLREQLIQNY